MTQSLSSGASSNAGAIAEVDGWSNALGRQIERHPRFFRWLGNVESAFARDTVGNLSIERPIYVSGLARSGSTILLELLARHPATATHRYRDFPLLHAPLAWNWFVDRAGSEPEQPRERAHRDRILVTRESPEAFEEVLWMAFFPDLHDAETSMVLDRQADNPAFDAFYTDHIRKMLKLRGGRRYLSKANYNLTRLGYIQGLLPDACFIVPIRDPVWHIASLMKQHRILCSLGAGDDNVRDHLRRAGHFEFGPDRRAMNMGDGQVGEIEQCWREGRDVEGWARSWASAYNLLASALEDPDLRKAILVVNYETLCREPAETVRTILAHCGLDDEGLADHAEATISPPGYYSPPFDDRELEIIKKHTDAVAGKFGYGSSA